MVDDNPEIREIFNEQLTAYEPKLITADPAEAIAAVSHREGPVTVISDLVFPDSDLIGFDVLRSSPYQALKYLYTSLGTEASIHNLAARAQITVVDKTQFPRVKFRQIAS